MKNIARTMLVAVLLTLFVSGASCGGGGGITPPPDIKIPEEITDTDNPASNTEEALCQ